MKKLLTLTLLSLLIANFVFSQETADPKKIDNKGRKIRYNIIKTNIVGLPLGHFNLSYERKLAKKVSALVGISVISLPLNNVYSSELDLGGSEPSKLNVSANLSGFSISPEIRYYLGKNAPRGYYFGLYIPIMSYNAKLTGNTSGTQTITLTEPNTNATYTENAPVNVNLDAKSGFAFYGLGISGGPQFLIGNRVSLEFYLNLAAGILTLRDVDLDFKGSSSFFTTNPSPTPVTLEEQDNITYTNASGQVITQVPGSSVNYKVNVNYQESQKIEGLAGSQFAVMPRLGFTLGVAF